MEKKIVELSSKTLLVDVSEYPLNFLIFPHRLTANAYVGCLHGCEYCYAKWYCKRDEIKVKLNAPEILKKELQNRIVKGKPRIPVCFGSISDPYQAIESKYQLTRKMLEVCDELSYPTFVVTKSNLVTKDKDVLSSLAKRNLAEVNFTVTPVKAKILSILEPQAPSNKKRLEAMKTLTQGGGVPCNLYLSPILPYISDDCLPSVLRKASESGSKCCGAVFLKIRPVIWKNLTGFLQANNSSLVKECDVVNLKGGVADMVATYEHLYFKRGTKDLSGYALPEMSYRRGLMEYIAEECKKLGMIFTSEEFIDLWTTPRSDCIDIGVHSPTVYDIIQFMKSQNPKETSLEETIEHIKKNFETEKNWEKLMRKYWDKVKLLI